jgi:hypothetical protein
VEGGSFIKKLASGILGVESDKEEHFQPLKASSARFLLNPSLVTRSGRGFDKNRAQTPGDENPKQYSNITLVIVILVKIFAYHNITTPA